MLQISQGYVNQHILITKQNTAIFLIKKCQWSVVLLVQYYFNDFRIKLMKFKILCVFICYVYFTHHFFACLDVWEVVYIYFKSLYHLQVSYGSVYGLEIEKQCMRLQRSLNNLMTDKLATSNKIKSCSVVLHMLLLQAVSVRELNQTEPSSVSKLV